MKYSIHSKKSIAYMALIMVVCLILGIYTFVCTYRLTSFTTPFFLYVFNVLICLVAFDAARKIIRHMSEMVEFGEDELSYYRFFQKQRSIKWNSIVDVGIGKVYTSYGIGYRIFFAKEKLTDEEIDNLDFSPDKTMYFEELTEETLGLISERCPIEIPGKVKAWIQYGKKGLS